MRVLIVATSHDKLGATGYPTGVWSTEAIHPWHVFHSAGIAVDFASPKGGAIPLDPYSDPRQPQLSMVKNDPVVDAFLADKNAMQQWNSSIPVEQIDASKYDAVFVAGGNGALFDLPSHPATVALLQRFADSSDKTIASVCHGSAALLHLKTADGTRPWVQGKRVTGFDNEEEAIAGAQIGVSYLPFYLETELRKQGALFVNGPPFSTFTAVDENGRLVTGQQVLEEEFFCIFLFNMFFLLKEFLRSSSSRTRCCRFASSSASAQVFCFVFDSGRAKRHFGNLVQRASGASCQERRSAAVSAAKFSD